MTATARTLVEAARDMLADIGDNAKELGAEHMAAAAQICIASALTAIALTLTDEPVMADGRARLRLDIESLERQKIELEVAVRAREARLK